MSAESTVLRKPEVSGGVRILDTRVVNQIAAGEVVERPASVVKELVENSIDAGATDISVVIGNGGRASIDVIDNGSGMNKDDALLAVERYGTSKIRTIEDLESILTLGFRGEALPSIASVSRFSLSTREQTAGEGQGVELQIEGGVFKGAHPKPQPPGTRVGVRDLFYNVPARRKFLRSPDTETGMVKSQLLDFAAAHPEVRFSLIVDGVQSLNLPKAVNFLQRIEQMKLVRGRAIVVDEASSGAAGSMRITGVLSEPLQSVAGAARLRLLVNGRSVRDKLMLKAVRDGYGAFLKPGRYPAGVISLAIAPGEVDVNVHPQKTEVRFRDSQSIYLALSRAVGRALHRTRPQDLAVPVQGGLENFGPTHSGGARPFSPPGADSASGLSPQLAEQRPSETQLAVDFFSGRSRAPLSAAQLQPEPTARLSSMRYVGQILSLYLLFEAKDALAIVDMHAAHERVTYFAIRSQLAGGSVPTQALLIAETFEVPPDRLAQFERYQPLLRKVGIECERFGDCGLKVRSLPAVLGRASAERIFSDLFSLPEWDDWLREIDRVFDQVIARLACHGSVRSGRELTAEEAYALLDSLEEAEASAYCPHGRPVVVFLSRGELEKMFGRAE